MPPAKSTSMVHASRCKSETTIKDPKNVRPKEKKTLPKTSETKKGHKKDEVKRGPSKQTGKPTEKPNSSKKTNNVRVAAKSRGSNQKPPSKAVNKRREKESEDESDQASNSSEGSSEEATESDSEKQKEEEHSSEQDRSTRSTSSEESEHKSYQDVKPTAEQEPEPKSDSDKAASESEEEQSPEPLNKPEKQQGGDSLKSDSTDASDEELAKKPITRSRRKTRQSSAPRTVQAQSKKMFRKNKGDKEAEKQEKRLAKAEKQRLEKEAKQKAKEDKKNLKILKKQEKSKSKKQAAGGVSNKNEPTKKIVHEDSMDNASEEEEEEEEDVIEPSLSTAMKAQDQVKLLKSKSKDLQTLLESEGKDQDQNKGTPDQRFLIKKAQMKALQKKTNTILNKSKQGEELLQAKAADGDIETSKITKQIISGKKGMTTLHKMSGWIQKKMHRGCNLRKKFSVWAKAIGLSRWLSVQAGKRKQSKPRSNLFKHRMAVKVAGKTTFASKKKKTSEAVKEKETTLEASLEVEERSTSGDKELEAKFAIVLPRMNKINKSKPNTNEGASTTSGVNEGASVSGESKLPKPGARLVLPVKPDLTLLKSIKKTLPVGMHAMEDRTEREFRDSPGISEVSENAAKRVALTNLKDNGILQSARAKMGPMSSTTPAGNVETVPAQSEATPHFQMNQAGLRVANVRSLYEEETDREVAELMGNRALYTIIQPDMHWAENPCMSGDPQTVEKLTRWTVYEDERQAQTTVSDKGRGPWESEDPTQEMLEHRLLSTQVVLPGSNRLVEVDELEDLSQLEEVSESSVLLNLRKRFQRDNIYTYIGNMLLSINPFKPLNIYTDELRLRYQGQEQHRNPP